MNNLLKFACDQVAEAIPLPEDSLNRFTDDKAIYIVDDPITKIRRAVVVTVTADKVHVSIHLSQLFNTRKFKKPISGLTLPILTLNGTIEAMGKGYQVYFMQDKTSFCFDLL